MDSGTPIIAIMIMEYTGELFDENFVVDKTTIMCDQLSIRMVSTMDRNSF